MPRESPASRVSKALAAAAPSRAVGLLGSVLTPISKPSISVRRVLPEPPGEAVAGALAASRIFSRRLSVRRAGGARAGARSNFEPNDVGVGADVHASLTVTLPDAARGVTERLRLPTGKDVDVKIPAGITNGQQIRLKGQGMPGQTGTGDVLITVSIAPHPVFTLEGADIRLDLPVTLYEAVLGAKVRVPTLDREVEITIPPWTSSGRTFRLKGKGFPAKSGRGDLFATVRIVLPDSSDSELEALMKKWQSGKPYDPRKNM